MSIDRRRSVDGKLLTLFCVNRSISVDAPVQFHLDHFRVASGPASGVQISAASRYVMNDEVESRRVVPQPITEATKDGQLMTVTLPQRA